MSIQAIARVLDLELNDVSAKAVLIGLANHTSPDGQCFPSIRRLMRYSGLSERAVRDTIKRLEELGLVLVDRQPGRRSIYQLQLPTPANPAGVDPDPTPAAPAGDPGKSCTTTPADAAPHNLKNNHKEPSDARAGLPDDWQPTPSLVTVLDYDYPNVDIGEQVKAFVLHNQAKGTVLANPDAAFKQWMNRIASLKLPVKQRPPPAQTAGVSSDPAVLARGLERAAEAKARWDRQTAAEEYLDVAAHYFRIDDKEGTLRCIEQATKLAKKGSWAWEQASAFKEKVDGQSADQADQGQHSTDHRAAGP